MDMTVTSQVSSLKPEIIKKREELFAIENLNVRDKEIAKWACDFGFEDLRPSLPPMPPSLLKERRIRAAKLRDGEALTEDIEFWNRAEIKDFTTRKWLCNLHNRDNFVWLGWIKDRLEPTDTQRLIKVRNRLYEFMLFFNEEPKREVPFKVFRRSNEINRDNVQSVQEVYSL